MAVPSVETGQPMPRYCCGAAGVVIEGAALALAECDHVQVSADGTGIFARHGRDKTVAVG